MAKEGRAKNMKITWNKLPVKQLEGKYKSQKALIYPLHKRMFHYDVWDANGKLIYTGKMRGLFRTKRHVKKLLKCEGEYWDWN